MWYDRDIDAVMRRTQSRALPSGKIEPGEALTFGVVLSVASVMVMALATNVVAAAWLALSIGFYVFVYTMWLKRRTAQNIVIGGAAGAFPPIIGWAAVTGDVSAMPLLLFAIIFLWTPPHFWALALYACKDYGRAGVPMLPVVAGAKHTRLQILLYTLVLAPVSVLPWMLGYAGPLYGLTAIALGLGFILSAVLVWRDKQDATGVSLTQDTPAKAAFRYLAGLSRDPVRSGRSRPLRCLKAFRRPCPRQKRQNCGSASAGATSPCWSHWCWSRRCSTRWPSSSWAAIDDAQHARGLGGGRVRGRHGGHGVRVRAALSAVLCGDRL